MRITHTLIGFWIAATAATALPACGASGHAVVVAEYEEPPPSPREEYVTYRPGYVWIQGNWVRDYNNRWRWRSGYFVRERPGYVYAPGRWERRGRQYIWVDGGWRTQGSIVIRGRGRF
jgi:hypothetical protein